MSESSSDRDLVARLHSAIRRYCGERHALWSARYAKLEQRGANRTSAPGGGWTYTEKARDIYPRYNVLAAILAEIEKVTADELGDLDESRQALARIITRAQSLFTDSPNDAVEETAMDEERELAVAQVMEIDEATLWETRLLPFRRTLGESEIERHWSELKQRWKVDGYWIPLVDAPIADEVVVMDAAAFRLAIRPVALQNKLRAAGVVQLYELREHDGSPSAFIDVELLDPYYDLAEGYWFPESKDWLLYASHELSITAGGRFLVDVIASLWPGYREHPWSMG